MARIACLAFGLALVSAWMAPRASAADAKTDVTGTWDFEVEISGQQGTPTFTFKQDGEKLTGKYKGQFGTADVTGEVKGNTIKFSFEIEGGQGKVTYTGTIDKDTMKGDTDYAGQASGTFKAKKSAK
jgi:hypothetical protein